jgi:hypothetical protein
MKNVECNCGTCTYWHENPDDYSNTLVDLNYHRECLKANLGVGTHIVSGFDEETAVYTSAGCYCPDYCPSSDYYLNMIEHLGEEVKHTIEIIPNEVKSASTIVAPSN